MNESEFLGRVRGIIDESGRALLATVNAEGFPTMRWMNPAYIPTRLRWLYCTTSRQFPKVNHVKAHPKVSWLLTEPRTGELFSLRGLMQVVDHPRFSAELLEELGRRLETFWKLRPDSADIVVLETELLSGEYFDPRSGNKLAFDLSKLG